MVTSSSFIMILISYLIVTWFSKIHLNISVVIPVSCQTRFRTVITMLWIRWDKGIRQWPTVCLKTWSKTKTSKVTDMELSYRAKLITSSSLIRWSKRTTLTLVEREVISIQPLSELITRKVMVEDSILRRILVQIMNPKLKTSNLIMFWIKTTIIKFKVQITTVDNKIMVASLCHLTNLSQTAVTASMATLPSWANRIFNIPHQFSNPSSRTADIIARGTRINKIQIKSIRLRKDPKYMAISKICINKRIH